MGEIADRVKKLIAARFDIDGASLTPETLLMTDLGADDLDIVELSIAFAREFKIEITDTDIEALKTIADAEVLITQKVQAPSCDPGVRPH